ncbi:MAG: lamin tail domain-containing protein [Acidimicrobiia bacterium]
MPRTGIASLVLLLAASACADSPAPSNAVVTETTAPSSPLTPPPAGAEATLQYVFDGDSIEVDLDGRTEEVRLVGINAPERDECFGDESREALIGLLGEGDLVLVSGSDGDTDRYGRLLRFVYVDGDNINGRTLANGNAVVLQSGHDYNPAFVEIGDLAAAAGYGMWGPDACGPAPPAGATIIEVLYNPPGPDDEVLNSEYVTIGNEGQATLDLTGWTLRDESSQNRYVFFDIRLEPGDHVTVRTGCGQDRDDSVFWCADRSVWSNSGDTAILQDRHGNVVDRWTYTGDS